MGKVKFDPLVSKTLNQLIPVLYIEGYFATREYAKAYVDGILAFCYAIPQRTAQLSKNTGYGKYYCQYKPNRHTTWYVFFDTEEDDYIIQRIMNNHSVEYADFVASLK